VLTLLAQGDLAEAAHLAETHKLPMSQARVHLAQGDAATALALLEPLGRHAEAKGWEDERLKVTLLQAVALHEQGEQEEALQILRDALVLARPGGFVRIFVDEGTPMAHLLSEALTRGMMPEYTGRLRAVLEAEKLEKQKRHDQSSLPLAAPPAVITPASPSPSARPLIEPLSGREIEVLQLMAEGLSNHEISQRLFLALSTVKGHNRIIFSKLQVERRTEAVARARELGLL
jgi:LuxR family maltose regulon positive regulatory protein